jgi:hypothetical protein
LEQHELSVVHVSPSGAQIELLSVHVPLVPPEQALPQHAVLEVQLPPAVVHVLAVEQVLFAGSQ